MLTPGFILQGRYQIIRALGSGAMGAVYLANHLALGKRVTIKENISNETAATQQFQTEAAILANLSHPHLPSVTDFFIEPNDTRYLVMDFIDGQNLEQLVEQRGRLSERDALAWMTQVFDAVKYLHSNRIIHRDIKPQNIIITPQGKAMLVDFGIAKIHAPGMPTVSGAHGLGTPGFAPLEQYSGGTDERSDIYALGATLYFLLTGQCPADAPMRAAGKSTLVAPRQLNPNISLNTENVIQTAMNLAATQRYNSISAMEYALKPAMNAYQTPATAVLAQQTKPAAVPSQSIPTHQPKFSLPTPLLIAIGVGLVAVIIIALALASQPTATPPVVRPVYPNAFTIELAKPYVTAQRAPIPPGQGLSFSTQVDKTARVVDLYAEMANESPVDVSLFIGPFCDKLQFAGSARIDANPNTRPVYIPLNSPVLVNGKFCLSLQASSDKVSLAQNQFAQPLIKVIVSYE